MSKKYAEYKGLNLPTVAEEVLENWDKKEIFEKSISSREGNEPFVFFEGPPSANGMPGIHHVMARAIKDIFCRYKTLKGFQVHRKAGWDTHGLPVELGVEKELGITKEDIGNKISVEEYNNACKETVMRYTDVWNDLTRKMGYWVNMEEPYITYDSKYMESVWWLLKEIYNKQLIYKGYTIQPYSPAAGTGLSSHELNQPGCYKDVKDTTATAQFKIRSDQSLPSALEAVKDNLYFIAWTTTPWTLPSNTALAVGPKIDYVLIKTFNQYTFEPMYVIAGKSLVGKVFAGKYKAAESEEDLATWTKEEKKIPYLIGEEFKGSDLAGIFYEQLLPLIQPSYDAEKAFQVILGDFVTTDDGTGIVHIAPTFGADDAMVAKNAGIPPLTVYDQNGKEVPLVNLQGRFIDGMGDLSGQPVKSEYYSKEELEAEMKAQGVEKEKELKSVDVKICIQLKEENKAFKVEKYEHSYPHCWRTDKPVLYYPLDSWFIKVTSMKDRLVDLNKTINWKPESTGTGRFGKWLSNLNDWNLSRSRYWGIPIPIWRTEEGDEEICIGSVEELKTEIDKSVAQGIMTENPIEGFEIGNNSKENYSLIDLHKNYVDEIVLVSSSGKPMKREADLIDVWFDSGSMPYAQLHYPFENKELVDDNKAFPADFIAEGVDQTRGWFYTLHAIGTMVFDSVAYKNVISNGLVLDKNGQKMSKRLGNSVDPFKTLSKYGPDATRWYMITNAQPWDNLKFDEEGILEVQRKFFGTLYNTYSFFTLYANIDEFDYSEADVPLSERPEIDQWIISKLNSLIAEVDDAFEAYEPTKAGRMIQSFVTDQLSNWYVRLCRRRFWKGELNEDKLAAYQTLYRCLEVVAQLSSSIAPFFADRLFMDLNKVSNRHQVDSVHLSHFPESKKEEIDVDLESRMEIAQRVTSLVLSLRKKEKIKVRQPLAKIMIPVLNDTFHKELQAVEDLVLSEVNIKELEYIFDTKGVITKKIKPNFKALGPRFGKQMKLVAQEIGKLDQDAIATFESSSTYLLQIEKEEYQLQLGDVDIVTEDIPGMLVASEGNITVAMDITISDELREEGIAREFVNRIQNLRKDQGLEITDRIELSIERNEKIEDAIQKNSEYICSEVLANSIHIVDRVEKGLVIEVEEGVEALISIDKLN